MANRGQSTSNHTTASSSSDVSTAAEPMSLARPDNLCLSSPMRSTVASMALLINSTISTMNIGAINRTRSMPFWPNQRPKGMTITARASSCRKAASSRNAPEKPFMLAPKALNMRVRPVGFNRST